MRKRLDDLPHAVSFARVSAREPRREIVEDERTYRFLTFVFGGGVKIDGARKPFDERTPIRVPSIRGQLRFWWRAVNPRKCLDLKELHARESEIFGSTTITSPLVITVKKQPGRPAGVEILEGKFDFKKGYRGIAYGAFPLRDKGDAPKHGVLHDYQGHAWTISLRYPLEHETDLRAALWAWAHFGGLGGRTRRGFGAIEELASTTARSLSIDDGWTRYVPDLSQRVEWPHLPKLENRRLVISSRRCSSEKDALDHLLGAMRDLRQGELGRKQSPEQGENRHPGRSYWPEADAIRECTNSSRRSRHSEPVTTTRAFPRAAFGLPIIFHFLAGSSDPIDTTLNPANRGRLASRLILRPHRAQSGAVEAMALVIEHRPAEAIVLSGGGMSKPKEVRASVTNDEAMSMAVGRRPRPLVKDGKPFADPIDRYLEEIR